MSEDRNDLAYWFPKLQATGVPVPRTEIITTELDLMPLCDGEGVEGFGGLLKDIHDAVTRLGGYPAFLRTGHGSGKHQWYSTCYLAYPTDLAANVARLVEWSATVDFMGLPTQTWVVREFLHLRSTFTAFEGMPISREFRSFIRDGVIECAHHPYWPPGAIRHPSEPHWEHLLAQMNHLGVAEENLLVATVGAVADGFDGYWSVDIAQTTKGEWVVTDMAEGERSYHWPECPHSSMYGSVLVESPSDLDRLLEIEEA